MRNRANVLRRCARLVTAHAGAGPWRALLGALLLLPTALAGAAAAPAGPLTVCTITVNSPDEKQAFRTHLPATRFRFVELVERGRPDWLEAACRAGTRCNVLVVSGHYDGGSVFFSDRLEREEFLPVAELERASCSGACPGLFADLQEVYLFGCNTLNPLRQGSAAAGVVRTLVGQGRPRDEADRLLRSLEGRQGRSSRDKMRSIFAGVPAIYGFAAAAPLGPTAAVALDAWLRNGGAAGVGDGRVDRGLLGAFEPVGLTVAAGVVDKDPAWAMRQDLCEFADERRTAAQRVQTVHRILQREPAVVRLDLDRIEALTAALDGRTRADPATAEALGAIERDIPARQRFLDHAHQASEPALRARLVELATGLGWLGAAQRRAEFERLLGEMLAGDAIDPDDVELACELDAGFGSGLEPAALAARPPAGIAHDAIRACLGDADARARLLQALPDAGSSGLGLVDAYLRRRPLASTDERRALAAAIFAQRDPALQAQALETLGRQHLADPVLLAAMLRLYRETRAPAVQAAVAGVLLRADLGPLAGTDLERQLREQRLDDAATPNLIDALLRHLQSP